MTNRNALGVIALSALLTTAGCGRKNTAASQPGQRRPARRGQHGRRGGEQGAYQVPDEVVENDTTPVKNLIAANKGGVVRIAPRTGGSSGAPIRVAAAGSLSALCRYASPGSRGRPQLPRRPGGEASDCRQCPQLQRPQFHLPLQRARRADRPDAERADHRLGLRSAKLRLPQLGGVDRRRRLERRNLPLPGRRAARRQLDLVSARRPDGEARRQLPGRIPGR